MNTNDDCIVTKKDHKRRPGVYEADTILQNTLQMHRQKR